MQTAKRLHWLRLATLLGMLVSAFLTYQYYAPATTPSCTLGDYFVCDLGDNAYATLDSISHFLSSDLGLFLPTVSLPIPNALLFFVAFLLLFFVLFHTTQGHSSFGMKPATALSTLKVIFYVLGAYSVFLMYVETYVLYTLCLLCFVTTILIFASLWFLVGMSTKQPSSRSVKRRR